MVQCWDKYFLLREVPDVVDLNAAFVGCPRKIHSLNAKLANNCCTLSMGNVGISLILYLIFGLGL